MAKVVNVARVAMYGILGLAVPGCAVHAQEWTARQEWRIDGDSAEFTRVGAIAVSAQGSLVMTQVLDGVAYLWPAGKAGVIRIGRLGEGPGQLLIQTRATENGKVVFNWTAGIDSRLIDLRNGAEIGRQADLPRAMAIHDGNILLTDDDPEPWVELRRFRIVASRLLSK